MMNLIVWSLIITFIVAVPVLAGRPQQTMDWSDHRRALRSLRRLHRERSG